MVANDLQYRLANVPTITMTIGCVVVAGFQIIKVEQETDFGSLFDDASVVQVFQPKGDAGVGRPESSGG